MIDDVIRKALQSKEVQDMLLQNGRSMIHEVLQVMIDECKNNGLKSISIKTLENLSKRFEQQSNGTDTQ